MYDSLSTTIADYTNILQRRLLHKSFRTGLIRTNGHVGLEQFGVFISARGILTLEGRFAMINII